MNRLTIMALVVALLMPAFMTGTGAQGGSQAGALVLGDPAGDVSPTGVAPADNPSKRLVDHIDMVELKIGPDTPDSLPVSLKFAGRDETFTTVSNAAAVNDASCYMELRYKDNPDVFYQLSFYTTDLVPGEGPTWTSRMYFRFDDGNDWNSDTTDAAADLTWDAAATTLHLDFDKSFIPLFPGPRNAGNGDLLLIEWLSCYTDTALYLGHNDRFDEEVAYPMRSGGTGSTVTMSFADAAQSDDGSADAVSWSFPTGGQRGPTSTTVAPGHPSIIPLRLENHADEKKLVILGVEAADADTEGWNLSIAESVFLKGGEVRTVNLVATPPADAELGRSLDIRVRSQLAATTETGELQRRLVVAPLFGEENPTVYFHTRPREYGEPTNTIDQTTGMRHDLMVSLLPEVDGWPSEPMESMLLRSNWVYDRLEPLSAPVRLLAEEDGIFQVTVTGEPEAEVQVYLYVGSEETGELYRYSARLSPGTHTVAMPSFLDEDTVLPAGTALGFDLNVYHSGTSKAGIDPTATHMTFPLRSETNGLNITDGRFIPTLALAEGEEATTYVNPGKEYAFELMIANDGIEEDDLQVTAVLENGTGWMIDVLPGSRFRVEPGTSTPVSVSVVAGEDTPEHDTAVIQVQATSKKDPDAFTKMTLKATMTEGAEIEAKPYQEKEDQLPPLTEEKESGGPVALLAALAMLGVAVRLRRKTREA